jgi:predicted nuclease of restriction endonuclease-like (RecB) superfamily
MSHKFEHKLYIELVQIIEHGKQNTIKKINHSVVMVYWYIGAKINNYIKENEGVKYAEKTVNKAALEWQQRYGSSFSLRNVRRMMQFAKEFSELSKVSQLATQLTWSHFIELLPLSKEARIFYAQNASLSRWSRNELRRQIERKAFERNELADLHLREEFTEIKNTFKDPYLLDFLGLKDGYLENDLESAIVKELENFILELGVGFSFIERQKRIILDGKDFYLDLLFYNRKLRRLVAIELKLGEFKAAYKGQMELYLKWLNRHEKQEGEAFPIGLILCAGKSTEQIELLEMHKDGIVVADYWTNLPPKEELERKLHSLLIETQQRIEERKLLDE